MANATNTNTDASPEESPYAPSVADGFEPAFDTEPNKHPRTGGSSSTAGHAVASPARLLRGLSVGTQDILQVLAHVGVFQAHCVLMVQGGWAGGNPVNRLWNSGGFAGPCSGTTCYHW